MAATGKSTKQAIYFRQKYSSLSKSITAVEQQISAILMQAYRSPKTGAAYWNRVRKDLDFQYKKLKVLYTKWSMINIPKAYTTSMQDIFSQLNKTKAIASRATKTFTQMSTSVSTMQLTKALYKDAIADYVAALNAGQQNLNRITRKTQQLLIDQSIVNETVARAIESGNLLNNKYYKAINLTETLAAQLKEAAEVVDNKYYVIAGKSRFKANYYAEMVTRVKFHEAQSYSAMNTAKNYGTSLVKVSYHNTKTAICQQYENMIFSMDGKDSRFPTLTFSPPFHPNCLHNLFPVFVETLEATGTLDKWIAYSGGTSNTPPSPPSFIPISERSS